MKQVNMLPPAPLRHHFDPYAIPPPPEDYLSPMEIMMNYRPVNERELYFKKERQLDLQDPEDSMICWERKCGAFASWSIFISLV